MANWRVRLTVILVLVVGVGYLAVQVRNHGFSAREQPSRIETFLARNARRIATPADAKELKNPYPPAAESLAEAREHFVAHCSTCHGLEGRGDTPVGRNLYPKAPDMTGRETQRLSDGELFYIISNGVRFTGMPAWGGEDSPRSIWDLVALIRRLPQLSPEERKLMQDLASGPGGEKPGAASSQHADRPGARPHQH